MQRGVPKHSGRFAPAQRILLIENCYFIYSCKANKFVRSNLFLLTTQRLRRGLALLAMLYGSSTHASRCLPHDTQRRDIGDSLHQRQHAGCVKEGQGNDADMAAT